MSGVKTYLALADGYVDDSYVKEGTTFSTAAPEGDWMQPLDKDGKPIEKKAKKAKAAKVEGVDPATHKAVVDRAEAAEKAHDEAAAEIEALKAEIAKLEAAKVDTSKAK
jgi:hypothetical protein